MQLDLTNEKERKKTFPGYEKTEVPLPYPITPVNIYPIPFHAHEWLSDDGGQTEYRQKSRANRVEEIEIEAVEAERRRRQKSEQRQQKLRRRRKSEPSSP
jgi:hypothetical protein